MKKKRQIIFVFIAGLLLGAVLMGMILLLTGSLQKQEAEDAKAQESWAAEAYSEEEEKIPSEEALPADEAETSESSTGKDSDTTWDKEAVYTGGEEAAYEGKLYRAKWWTQGETPGTADVWEDLLIAAGETLTENEAETLPQNETANDTKISGGEKSFVKREDFKVVGYFPSWKESTEKIQYGVLTHINYAFAIPTQEGTLLPLENEAVAKKMIAEAHRKDVKVFLAVGGWSYHEVPLESTFVSATETKEKREQLAGEIIAMCEKYGFDGIDLDWEHPRVDGESGKQYEELVQILAKGLHEKGKELSSAVLSGVTPDGNIYYDAAAHSDKVLAAVDWINVMAYDGGDGERHSSYAFATKSGSYWKNVRKMPAEKVVLGVPFYARPSWAAYGDILSQVPDAWKSDHVDYNGMEAWYNGTDTIEKKTTYALENLGGIMIWEISQDASGEYSLQNVIGKCIEDFGK